MCLPVLDIRGGPIALFAEVPVADAEAGVPFLRARIPVPVVNDKKVALSSISQPLLKEPTRTRSLFPESWLWTEVTIGYLTFDLVNASERQNIGRLWGKE